MKTIKNLCSRLLRLAYKLFWLFPLRKNAVFFRSSQGESYSCCPKYICEYLLKNCPGEFRIEWVFNTPQHFSFLEERGIKLCRSNSLSAIYRMATAKFIIDNHGITSYFSKRKGQVVLNTWHGGGAYKKGFKNQAASHTAYTAIMKENTDYLIASCEKFARCSFFRDMPEKILPFGMARSDIFFTDTTALKNKVHAYYNVKADEKILLYAPTYRYYEADTFYGLDGDSALQACEQRFGGRFRLVYRMHEFIKHNHTDFDTTDYICANDYEDVQELIAAADVIITDYSSLIWDAALSDTPCFIFAADLKEFTRERDFHTPIQEWPFPLAEDNEALTSIILSFNEQKYRTDCAEHLKALGSFETGHSAEQTAALMKQYKNN